MNTRGTATVDDIHEVDAAGALLLAEVVAARMVDKSPWSVLGSFDQLVQHNLQILRRDGGTLRGKRVVVVGIPRG